MTLFSSIADLLLAPVQLAIYALFVVSLFEAGRMIVQWGLRLGGRKSFSRFADPNEGGGLAGYPILRFYASDRSLTLDDLDVEAMRRLEFIRIATRVTPMLGLMATLIPMGPALLALTRNDVGQMSELLRSAFSSVVLALASASLCFWIATIRRRWCAEELVALRRSIGGAP
jgi:biopolymer transport protein ExbB/TolQ